MNNAASLIPALPALGWIALGVIPPLILMLYFLKLRRTPVAVPSTYLWTKTIEDMHVNSIWQKLRNSLLLWLQLLLAMLLLAACLRPGCSGEELAGERFIFLIDNSSSMSARDLLEGDNSRLEEAKEQVVNLIERMAPSDIAMVISFSDRALVEQSYTRNKSVLKRKVNRIRQTERGSDLNEALLAASGLANPGRTGTKVGDLQVADALAAELFIFSDGGVREIPKFNMGNLKPEYHPMGSPSIEPRKNIGITAFSINTGGDSKSGVQAFSRIMNSDDEDHTVSVSLYVNGELFDSDGSVTVPAEGSTSLSFDMTGTDEKLDEPVPVSLKIETEDVYEQDNIAYGVLNPPRLSRVLVVTELNNFMRDACETDAAKELAFVEFEGTQILKDKSYIENASLGLYDLIIYDQCSPDTMPQCNTMFLGATPPGKTWTADEERGPVTIIDFDTSNPLMFAVSMANVLIVNAQPLKGPPGSLPLLESDFGDIMVLGPRGGFEDLVIGFPMSTFDGDGNEAINTDWGNNLSFPLFMQNVLSILGGGARFSEAKGNRPGQAFPVKPQFPTDQITVKNPAGNTSTLEARGDGVFILGQTETAGIYSVTNVATKELDQLVAVNLFDSRESNMRVRDELKIGYEEVAGTRETQPARKEFWTWIVLAALAVLLIEWFIYNKRVFI